MIFKEASQPCNCATTEYANPPEFHDMRPETGSGNLLSEGEKSVTKARVDPCDTDMRDICASEG